MRQGALSTTISNGGAAFVANKGQWDSEALFLSRTSGIDTWVTATGVVYDFYRVVEDLELSRPADLREELARGPRPYGVTEAQWNRRSMDPREEPRERRERSHRVGHVVRLQFLDTAPIQGAVGQAEVPGHFNYFLGNDRSKWASDVPRYERARVRKIYPGIDAVYYVDQGSPRYDVVVQPGANPARIRFRLAGATSVRVTPDGRLAMGTQFGEVEQRDLLAYQGADRRPIPCRYAVAGDGTVSFRLGAYNRSKPMVIDPLVYSTYLGGAAGYDVADGVALDASGAATVVGYTQSADFPTTPGAYDRTFGGWNFDTFVTRLSPTGSSLLNSTYLGGPRHDYAYGVALDATGAATVVGKTDSADFPTTPGAYDRTYGGNYVDAFVTRLSPTGSSLLYSTYLGGAADDSANGVALDAAGAATVVGETFSSDFPTTPGAYDRTRNGSAYNGDAFVTRLSPTGESLINSTYLGGPGHDGANCVALDAAGAATVEGFTYSPYFPTTPGAYDRTLGGEADAFVTRLSPTGSSLLYSTYLGGAGGDYALDVAVDEVGAATVVGRTYSPDFPTTPGAYDRTFGGNWDAFVTRLSPTGSSLLYSTYLGGAGYDYAQGVAVDATGAATVVGMTESSEFSTTPGAFDRTFGGSAQDAFVTRLSPSGSSLIYSTALGGARDDAAGGVALDAAGAATVVGNTNSTDFPTTLGANDRTYGGGIYDAFVTKLALRVVLVNVALEDFTGPIEKLPVSLELLDARGTVVEHSEVALEATGLAVTDTAQIGTFSLRVKVGHWLAMKTGSMTFNATATTFPSVLLVNGDVDGDNAVTVFDYDRLSSAYDSQIGEVNWNADADLNGDGAVTVFDYDILNRNFDRTGD